MSKTGNVIFDIHSIQLKGFSIFAIFYTVFFLYQRTIVYDRLELLISVYTLAFIIFMISCYRLRSGLFIFIFFIPLLGSVNTMFSSRGGSNILILFLFLFLGFLVNSYKEQCTGFIIDGRRGICFERALIMPVMLFSIIILISCIITIYRYLNFLPLLSSKFNDLAVNVNSVRAENSIYWTLRWFFNALIGIGLALVIYNAFKSIRDIIKAVLTAAASSIIVISVGSYQYFIDPTLGSFSQWVESSRINSTLTDPNSLGNYALIMFPVFLVLIIYFKKWYQRAGFSSLLLIFTAITFLSGSRNALIGAFISISIFLVLGMIRLAGIIKARCRASRTERRAWASAAVLLLTLVILFIAAVSYIAVKKPELKDMYRPPETGVSLVDRSVDTVWMSYNVYRQAGIIEAFRSVSSERHFLWAQAMDMFKEHPVSGIGLGGFLIELPNYYEKNAAPVRIMDFTGNYYLQIMSELGVTGLVLVIAIFLSIIRTAAAYLFKKENRDVFSREDWFLRGLLISFISTVAVLFFGPHTNFNEIQFSFWLVIGLLLVFVKIKGSGKRVLTRPDPLRFLIVGRDPGMAQKVSFALVIVIFSASLFVSSWTALSINSKRAEYGFEGSYGFYGEETVNGSVFRWTAIDASEIINKNAGSMIIPVKDSDPADNRLPLLIRFFIGNSLVKVVRIDDRGWHDITIPHKDHYGERFVLTISCSRSWTPKERGLSNDTRELGVMVGDYRFIE